MNKVVSTESAVSRLRRSLNAHATAVTMAQRHIQMVEGRLKAQSVFEDKIKTLETAISRHADHIAERNRAVEAANYELHQARLELIKAKREITALRGTLRELSDDI